MVEEDPPGAFVIDQHYELGDGGARIEDEDHTLAHTTREYFYDGLRRLRTVVLERPGTSPSDHDAVTLTVHYDHRARPYLVTVTNEDTDVTEANRYYYDQDDQLLSWIHTPDLGTATTYDQRQYVRIGDFAVGEMARSWVSGSATRHTYLHTTEPMGLETAAYEFEHPGGASVSYNPSTVVRQWTAFGRSLVATGSGEPLPTRFPGQLELRGSDVRIWDGSVTVAHRDGLYLNRWRVYDPRVGQYLQPDPEAADGADAWDHVLSYSAVAPTDFADPLGRQAQPVPTPQLPQPSPIPWCQSHPVECALVFGGAGAAAAAQRSPPTACEDSTSDSARAAQRGSGPWIQGGCDPDHAAARTCRRCAAA
jgi:RHS repeat-associated protein